MMVGHLYVGLYDFGGGVEADALAGVGVIVGLGAFLASNSH